MAAQQSAGTLLFRRRDGGIEVLVVHPSGNYNRHSPWSIPKGEPNPGETLEAAARRETHEETGVVPGHLAPLGHVDYSRSRKRVYCFAGEAPRGAVPRCASWEVDRAEFVDIETCAARLHPDQAVFLSRLLEHVASEPGH